MQSCFSCPSGFELPPEACIINFYGVIIRLADLKDAIDRQTRLSLDQQRAF